MVCNSHEYSHLATAQGSSRRAFLPLWMGKCETDGPQRLTQWQLFYNQRFFRCQPQGEDGSVLNYPVASCKFLSPGRCPRQALTYHTGLCQGCWESLLSAANIPSKDPTPPRYNRTVNQIKIFLN